ncbi:MAG: gluconokinase [Pseudomonadota bacterium]
MTAHGPARVIVMGVTGCGKTTVGALLAGRLGADFLDGDDYHPPENVAKMSAGTPLTDEDRWPWLDRLSEVMNSAVSQRGRVVLACSALRRVYRDRLMRGCAEAPLFIHLSGGRELIHERMAARREHYMPVALLDSQIATLEEIAPEENAMVTEIDAPVDQVVGRILTELGL